MSDFSHYKKGNERSATAWSRVQASFLLSCGNLGYRPSGSHLCPPLFAHFSPTPSGCLSAFFFKSKAFPTKLQLIPWRTAVTLNTVHISSLPRYPLGITAGYTTNGVGPISGWYSWPQSVPTSPPATSPCWACSTSKGTRKRQSFDESSSALKVLSSDLTRVRLRPEPGVSCSDLQTP